ncbi:hypothetical protein H0W26_01070 [Candidatus Dependentiae bacterium]|nr:hypothetical protein [Candidatus Dependentiae bacterium]
MKNSLKTIYSIVLSCTFSISIKGMEGSPQEHKEKDLKDLIYSTLVHELHMYRGTSEKRELRGDQIVYQDITLPNGKIVRLFDERVPKDKD